MSLCVVDCAGTSVPTVAGRLGIPVVSRETTRRALPPPRGVGGSALLGITALLWPSRLAAEECRFPVGLRSRGHADLSVSATNSGGMYTGELIPNTRDR